MSAATLHELANAARVLRDAVRDRSYRATPLGLHVARYYRWKKNEWGASPLTLRDYEAILRNLALYFADLELADFAPPVGIERLREAWDHDYGDRSPRTRAKVRSAYIDFFEWAIREGHLHGNPARGLARPKTHDVPVELFSPTFVHDVVSAQTYPADWIGATLILQYGLRRSGIASIRGGSFDVERRLLTVRTKDRQIHTIEIVHEGVWTRLLELELDGWGADHWLIYRQDTRRRKVPLEEATEVLDLGRGRRQGYANRTTRSHAAEPTGKLVHLWWYRCLERAGIVAKGTTAGTNMHRGRHTSATELLRETHDLRLTQQLLGHRDIRSTTRYAHLDTSDLAAALRRTYEDDDE